MNGTLWVVGTPIGNLEDLTPRARRILSEVDVVAAEDTRRTGRLLQLIGARPRLVSFFEGNEEERVPQLIEKLLAGSDVAVVTEAGMPAISDPGYRLVVACVDAGISVDTAPGPSAVITSLVLSGLPTDRFVFEGFLPRTGRTRRDRIAALAAESRTVILFESPRRLGATLSDLLAVTGERRVAVARELTKLHQEMIRGLLSDVMRQVQDRQLKGEVVVVMEGARRGLGAVPGDGRDVGDAVRFAQALLREGGRKRMAAKRAAEATGVPSGVIYDALVSSDHEPADDQGAEAGSSKASRGRRADSSE